MIVLSFAPSSRRFCDCLDFAIVEACDGIDGVRTARESHPAVILMDLNTPGLDWCSAIARLRCDESTENIPVIVLTGEHESSMLDRARLAGCAGILHKPCSPDRVLAEILTILAVVPPDMQEAGP